MTGKLTGRRILITGAASGMGRAIARLFREEGASLALLDINEAALTEVARSIEGNGGQRAGTTTVRTYRCDVSSYTEVVSAVAAATNSFGGFDGIVNAAGILMMTPIEDLEPARFQRMLSVNLLGPYHVLRATLKTLRQAPEATVVNIASVSGYLPMPGSSGYSASKAGLIMFTKGIALELAPKIRCNTICPGTIRTEMTRYIWENPEHAQRAADRAALKRLGSADEVARAALFLTSSESSFTTGTEITVDGGFSWH